MHVFTHYGANSGFNVVGMVILLKSALSNIT